MKRLFITILAVFLSLSLFASVTTSEIVKDERGWRFYVNGESFPVYGMVWSYTPVGYDSTYSLWDKDPSFIKAMIDTDMKYLKDMGVNMIRCFDDVPPEWVEYIYHEYGITTMINNLLGRYGVTADGIWYSTTDYADRHTQEELIRMAAESAMKYKDVDGVVMYMLGNESNYGLVWEGSEIQDLPTENQNAIMAGYLYDLLEKAMATIKEIDPNRVVGFINGDVQNMELIEELCPSLDVFGVNIYRGGAFGDAFYNTVADSIDKPILVTESGADAYNAVTEQEDQYMQASYIAQQWKDIYDHAWGKGRSGNIIGAFVFEWLDEWWKIYQYMDLDIHNTEATWGNAGYSMDYTPLGNNMNEEWFGIAAQGVMDDNFIAKRVPRAAYYLLSDVFKLNMFEASQEEIDNLFSSLDMNEYLVRGEANTLSDKIDDKVKIRIDHASINTEMSVPFAVTGKEVLSDDYDPSAKARVEGELTVAVDAFERFSGDITLNAWSDKPTYLLEDAAPYYNDYYVAVNSANISYTGDVVEIAGHYHDQIGGFSSMGDVFTLVPDQYDNSATNTSPTGIEIIGKDYLDGLRIVGGTEIYDGARPQIVAGYHKYMPGDTLSWYVSGIGGVEYTEGNDNSILPVNVKASVSGAMYLDPWVDVQLSLLFTGMDKLGADYLSDDGSIKQIGILDTFGAQLSIESKMFSRFNIFAKADYRGLVAETNEPDATSYLFYVDGGQGNRIQVEGGASFTYGAHSVTALMRYRIPLEKAMDRGIDSPFRVGGNKETLQAELSYIYDEEGMTNFYAWNREDVEGSRIAGGIAVLYSIYEGATDKGSYVTADGYSAELSADPEFKNAISVKGNLVLNLVPGLRIAAHAGFDRGMTASYDESYLLNSINFGIDARWKNLLLMTDFSVDGLGPEQWQKDQGVSYPYQWTVDLRYGFNTPAFLNAENSIGIRWDGVVFGAHSSYGWDRFFADDYDAIGNAVSQLTIYYNLNW